MNKLVKILDNTISWIMVTLMAVLVIVVTWQVFTRYVLGEASSYSEETARFLLIWIGLLGAAYAYKQNMHLAFDLFTNRATGVRKFWMDIIIHLLVALFSALVLVLGGFYLVQLTWEMNQLSASLQIPLAYVYTALPLSGLIIVFYSGWFIRKIIIEGPIEPKQPIDGVA
ncbi:TRAP transporter small permease [soil metagenome]